MSGSIRVFTLATEFFLVSFKLIEVSPGPLPSSALCLPLPSLLPFFPSCFAPAHASAPPLNCCAPFVHSATTHTQGPSEMWSDLFRAVYTRHLAMQQHEDNSSLTS